MKRLFQLIPAIVFLLAWERFSSSDPERLFLFSSPKQILLVAWDELQEGSYWKEVAYTTFEALSGLLLGTVFGSLGGLLLWTSPRSAELCRPYLTFFGAIPIFAIAPMFIIWFGTGLLSKCLMASCGVFFVALAQTWEGASTCSDHLSLYLRSIGASRSLVLRKVILPGTFRSIISGAQMGIGVALLGAFVAEFVSSEFGLGHYILRAGSLYDTSRVLLGVSTLSGLALLLSSCVRCLGAQSGPGRPLP